jgi:glycosyltransferase involved in cell wall biosynthesis
MRLFGEQYESATVIPHAILPTNHGSDIPLSSGIAETLPEKYIIFPANITTHKNHYTLLVAWSRFSRRKEFPLVLFGLGTEALTNRIRIHLLIDKVRGIINRSGLKSEEDFYTLGYVDDAEVLPLIKGASALIMPTLAEGGGSYPVEEALSVGVPVLCSDIPVMREHLAGRSAKIAWFDPESVESMLRALTDLFDNYDEYRQAALDGVNDPRYTWEDIANQYVNVFREVIEKSEHGPN